MTKFCWIFSILLLPPLLHNPKGDLLLGDLHLALLHHDLLAAEVDGYLEPVCKLFALNNRHRVCLFCLARVGAELKFRVPYSDAEAYFVAVRLVEFVHRFCKRRGRVHNRFYAEFIASLAPADEILVAVKFFGKIFDDLFYLVLFQRLVVALKEALCDKANKVVRAVDVAKRERVYLRVRVDKLVEYRGKIGVIFDAKLVLGKVEVRDDILDRDGEAPLRIVRLRRVKNIGSRRVDGGELRKVAHYNFVRTEAYHRRGAVRLVWHEHRELVAMLANH